MTLVTKQFGISVVIAINLFLINNTCPMLYFLLKKENELQIHPVRSENELLFRTLFNEQILIHSEYTTFWRKIQDWMSK